jgi:TonB family protein
MKRCTTCQEEFADKFGFCPVDGTPLSLYVNEPQPKEAVAPLADTFQSRAEEITAALETPREEVAAPLEIATTFYQAATTNGTPVVEEPAAVEAPSSGALARRDELHLTILEEKGVVARLGQELAQVARDSQLTWPEFKRSPIGFVGRTVTGYGSAFWAVVSRPAVAWGLLTAAVSLGLVVGAILFAEKNPNAGPALSRFMAKAAIPVGIVVLGGLAWWVRKAGAAAAASLLTALATVGLIVAAIALLDKGQTAGATISRGTVAGLSVGALALLGGLLVAWLRRERPMDFEAASGLGGRGYLAESGSSGHDLAAVAASLVFVTLLGAGLYFGSSFLTARKENNQELVLTQLIDEPTEIPKKEEEPKKEGPAGNNKGKGGGSKPEFKKPQGGGGGGKEDETKPVSKGETPPMVNEPQIVTPKVTPPPNRPPLLPVMPTLVGDPALTKMPKNMQFGDPDSKSTDPSQGKGTGGGFGGGNGSGAGTGDGPGLGPGRGGNTGGGDRADGGGGPGGGGDGKPAIDYNRPFSAKEVTRKAVITLKPEPPYTEDARKNNTVGTVMLRVLLGANGSVASVTPITRLPHGLTESAVAAARRIKFIPAQKDGRNVAQYVQLQYDFNVY